MDDSIVALVTFSGVSWGLYLTPVSAIFAEHTPFCADTDTGKNMESVSDLRVFVASAGEFPNGLAVGGNGSTQAETLSGRGALVFGTPESVANVTFRASCGDTFGLLSVRSVDLTYVCLASVTQVQVWRSSAQPSKAISEPLEDAALTISIHFSAPLVRSLNNASLRASGFLLDGTPWMSTDGQIAFVNASVVGNASELSLQVRRDLGAGHQSSSKAFQWEFRQRPKSVILWSGPAGAETEQQQGGTITSSDSLFARLSFATPKGPSQVSAFQLDISGLVVSGSPASLNDDDTEWLVPLAIPDGSRGLLSVNSLNSGPLGTSPGLIPAAKAATGAFRAEVLSIQLVKPGSCTELDKFTPDGGTSTQVVSNQMDLLVDFGAAVSNFSEKALNLTNLKSRGEAEIVQASATNQAAGKRWRVPLEVNATGGDAISIAVSVRVGPDSATLPQLTGNASLLLDFGLVRPSDIAVMSGATPSALTPSIDGVADASMNLWVVVSFPLAVNTMRLQHFVLQGLKETPGAKPVALQDAPSLETLSSSLDSGAKHWALRVTPVDFADSASANTRLSDACEPGNAGCVNQAPSISSHATGVTLSLRSVATTLQVVEWDAELQTPKNTMALNSSASSASCFAVIATFMTGLRSLDVADFRLAGLSASISNDDCGSANLGQQLPNSTDANGREWRLLVVPLEFGNASVSLKGGLGTSSPSYTLGPSVHDWHFELRVQVTSLDWLTCAANPCQALTSSATTDRSLALRVTFNRPVAHFVAARDLALAGLAVSGESSDPGPRVVWEVHLVPTAERSDVSATVLPFRSGLCNASEVGSSWSWASGPATSCSLATPRIAATGPMAATLQVRAKPTALGFYKQPVLDPGSKIAPDTAASDLWVVADLSLPVCGLPARAFVMSNATATLSDPVAVRMDETALSGGCSSRWAMRVRVHDRAGSIRAEVRHMASCDSLDGQADEDRCFAAPPSPLLEADSSASASISLRTRVTSVSVFEGSLAKAGERTLAEEVRSGGSSSETCFTLVVEFERGVSGLEAGDVDLVGLEATECSTQTASQPQSDATGQRWLLHVSVGAVITSPEMGAGIRPSSGRTDPRIDVSQAPSAKFEFRSRVASVEVEQLTASEGAGEPPFPATSTLRVKFFYERPVRDFDASRDAWLVGGRFVAGSQAAIEPSGWEFHITPTGSTAEVLVVALHWQNRSCDWTSGASRSAMPCSVTVPRVAADGKAVRVAHVPVSVEPEDAKLLPYPAIAKSISLDGTSVTVNNFWVLITFEQPVANVPLSAFGFVGLEPFSSLDRNDLSIEYLSTPAAVQANASELLGWDCQGCSRFWSLFVKASGGTNSLSFFAAEASTCPNEGDQCALPRPLVESSGAIKSGDVQFRSSVVKLEFVEVLNRGQSFAVVSDGGFVTSQCLSARVTFAEGVRNLTASHFRLQTVEALDCDKGNAASVPAPVAGDEKVWQLPVTLALGDLDKEFSFVMDADAQPPSVPNFVATSMRSSATFRARVNTVRLLDSRTGADLSGGLITSDTVEIVTELSSPVARFQTKLDMWVIGGTVVWEEFSTENADQARNTWRANATIDPGASVFYVETKPSQAYLSPASAPHRVMATQKTVAVWEDDNGDGRPGDGEQRVANGGVTSARCLSVRVAFGSGIRGLTAKHFDLRGLLPQRCRPHASSVPAEPSEAVQLDEFGAEWALGVVVAPETARVTAGLFEPGTAGSPMTSPSYRVTSSASALEYRVRLLGMSLWEVAGAVGAQTPAGREVTAGSTSATRLKLRVQFEGPVRGLSAGRDISLDGLRVVEESPDSGPNGQHFADVWNITVEPTGERSDVTATLVPFEEHVCVGGEGPASVAWSGGDAASSCSAAVPRLAGYGPSGHVVGTTFFAVPVGVTFRSEPSTDASFLLETVTVLSSVWAVVEYSTNLDMSRLFTRPPWIGIALVEDDNGDGRPGDGEQRVANGGVTSARCLSVRVAFGSGIRGLTAKHFDLRGLLPQRCRPHASSVPAEPSEAVQLDEFGAEWALGVVVAPETARVTAGLFEPGTAGSPMTSPSYRVTSSASALEYRVRLLGMSLWEVAGAVGAQTPAGREVTAGSTSATRLKLRVQFEGPVRGLSAGRDISLDGLRVVEESPDSGPNGQHFADVWNITVEPTGERSDVTATLVPFEEHVCVGGEGPASVAWSGGDAASSCSAAVPRLAGYGLSGHVVGTTFFAVPVGVTFRSEPSTDASFLLETVTVLSSVWAVVEYSVPVSAVPREALRGRYNSLSRATAALVRSDASDIAIVEDTDGDGRPGDGEQRVANGGVTSARCLSVRVAFGSGIRGLTAKHFDLRGLLPQRCRPHASSVPAEPSEAVQLDEFGAEWSPWRRRGSRNGAGVTAGPFEPGTAGSPMTSPSYRVTSSASALEYRVRLLGMSLWEVAGAVGAQTPAGREVTAGSTSATRLKLRVQFEGPVRGLSAGRDISLDGLRVVEESPDSGPNGQHFADVWNIPVEPTGRALRRHSDVGAV
ncbi:hypothetical protein FNF28_05169 [Cafeteria roenbergensis]|uniref:Uncharacterized protein n=1 Tax=Cafeteria roenbergensis TaxID=33653 RepID=A0A5A8D9D9_CAFRO|nr:hypothetical protein FNF28_05169 [Cafeteria roenbergensis]